MQKALRWAGLLILLILLMFFITSPAIVEAEILPLPFDSEQPGYPVNEANYISDSEYQDESIHVTLERTEYQKTECIIARVTIADPSQMRTIMTDGGAMNHEYVKPKLLVKKANAVLAMNGDFFKYTRFGYLIRQTVLYRAKPDANHDILLIDNLGDFHVVPNGTNESVAEAVAALPKGVFVYNSFNFGPLLIENGKVLNFRQDQYQAEYKQQRIVLAQTGPLSYAVFHCYGSADGKAGLTLNDFAAFIIQNAPDVRYAYNFDGGGSACLFFHNEKQHKNPNQRNLSDMIYFCSAVPGKEP